MGQLTATVLHTSITALRQHTYVSRSTIQVTWYNLADLFPRTIDNWSWPHGNFRAAMQAVLCTPFTDSSGNLLRCVLRNRQFFFPRATKVEITNQKITSSTWNRLYRVSYLSSSDSLQMGIFNLVGPPGHDPGTCRLWVSCSSNWATGP